MTMKNLFSQLKNYLPNYLDPQENYTTECLAACLMLSSKVRRVVIEYLVGDDRVAVESSELEVATQEPIEDGYVDLVLQQNGRFVIAVEVKVNSPEDCDHHRNQLRNYKKWLDKREPVGRLFTLVRNEDDAFQSQKYGADGRRTWFGPYKRFQTMLRDNDLHDVESSLIKNFCDYLESEAIVSTYEVTDLLSYAAGLKGAQCCQWYIQPNCFAS